MFFRIVVSLLVVVLLGFVDQSHGNACDDTNCVFNSGGCTNERVCGTRSATNPMGSDG